MKLKVTKGGTKFPWDSYIPLWNISFSNREQCIYERVRWDN